MNLFRQGKHDQRLHVYVVERIAKSPYYDDQHESIQSTTVNGSLTYGPGARMGSESQISGHMLAPAPFRNCLLAPAPFRNCL